MSDVYSSGNKIVDQMADISFTGNIIPSIWYQRILRENGHPHHLAISILAELCYWYRPTEVRDEITGNTVGIKKRFRGDLLQKSYGQLAMRFGESKKTIQRALDCLEDLGLIERILRNETLSNGMRVSNVMYIKLNPARIAEITRLEETQAMDIPIDKSDHTPRSDLSVSPVSDVNTNTEITKEITDKEYLIHPSADNMLSEEYGLKNDEIDSIKSIEQYRMDVSLQIEYDSLLENSRPGAEDILSEIQELITEVYANPRDTLRIGGVEYRWSYVADRFRKLTYDHIRYVITCMEDNTSKIHNIRSYLLTVLFNAPATIGSYYQAEANHDLAGAD
jgi:DNA-binding transcriptional ArsR family regulator